MGKAVATGNMAKIAIYLFLVTATFGFMQPFQPLYLSAAGFSNFQIGLAGSIGTGLAMLVQPVLGRWSDRLDQRRPFIVTSAILAAAAVSGYRYAQTFEQFLVLTAIGANGVIYLQAAGAALVGRLVAADGARQGGAAYANLRVWGSIGYILVSLASGIAVAIRGPFTGSRAELDSIFTFGPALFLLVALLAPWLPDRPCHETPAIAHPTPISVNFRAFLASYFLYILALYGASGFISLFLKSLGTSGIWLTLTFAGGVVVEVLVMRHAGRLSDTYGRRPILAITYLLLPIRMLMYAPAPNSAWVATVQLLHGINFGVMGAVAIAFANDLAKSGGHGLAQGRLSAAAGLAGAVGPLLFGAVSDLWGLRYLFVASSVIATGAAFIFMRYVHDSHQESTSIASVGPPWLRPMLRWLDAPSEPRTPT